MQVTKVRIADIELPTRIRAVDPQHVKTLQASMEELGLLNPITLFQGENGEKVLAAGVHRLMAAKALGRTWIQANVMTGEDVNREIAEIDENLCRLELGPAMRSFQMSRRKELWAARHARPASGFEDGASSADTVPPDLGGQSLATKAGAAQAIGVDGPQNVDAKSHQKPQQQHGFAASTAMITGDSKAAINSYVYRGQTLGAALRDIAKTCLDKGVELDALTKLQPEEREDLIRRAKAGEGVSAQKALAAKNRSTEIQNKRLVKRAVSALERCANGMDEQEFGTAMLSIEITDVVRRLAGAIATGTPQIKDDFAEADQSSSPYQVCPR